MDAIRAVVVDPSVAGRLVIREVEAPTASRSEALVRVKAISLNRGEVRTASTAEAGWRPGWDFAGVVEQQATDGSGPPTGARVVGTLDNGAWAELLAVPTFRLANCRPDCPLDARTWRLIARQARSDYRRFRWCGSFCLPACQSRGSLRRWRSAPICLSRYGQSCRSASGRRQR